MLQKSTTDKIAADFFMHPNKQFYLIELSRRNKIAHTVVTTAIKMLLENKLILQNIEKRGKRKFPIYYANLNAKEYRKEKKIYNFSLILRSGIIEFLEEQLSPKTIILFGSFQKGEDIETSDIDLFAQCSAEKIDISSFEQKIGRKIELHFNKKFSTYPKELKNNIANGIVLSGFLEVF